MTAIRNWLATLVLGIGLMANVAAMPVAMHFTVSGFANSPPTSPVTGTINWDAPSLNADVTSIRSITLTLGGHTYTVPEVGYVNISGASYIGGVVDTISGVVGAKDDFFITWDPSTLTPQFFVYSTSGNGTVWFSTQFDSFSIAEGTSWRIAYAPATSTPVPTLSEWGLTFLAIAIAMVAVVALRRKASNKTLASIALLSALVLGAFSGDKLIGNAWAPPPAMDQPAGGTVNVDYSGTVGILNNSGVEQTIISITPTVAISTPSPTCAVNLVVPAGGQCYVADQSIQPSDRRLKKEVVYLATLDNGIKVYSFKYLSGDDTHVGVMAQDLLDDPQYRNAVVLDADGYYKVNYHALGLRMISLSEWKQSTRNIFADSVANLAFQRVAKEPSH
jgi:hypothetical protein